MSSRSAAAAWGCHVHNEVNKSLDKEIFDCSNIGDFYDCGCAEDEEASDEITGQKEKLKGGNGKDLDVETLEADPPMHLEKEG